MRYVVFFLMSLFICVFVSQAQAKEIFLKNGDKYSGTILKEDDASIILQTQGAGDITIDKNYIDQSKTNPPQNEPPVNQPPAVQWTKDMSVGYTKTGGNTRKSQGSISASLNRKTKTNEATAKFNSIYSTNNNKIDAKKFYGLLRYAKSTGRDLKWYSFAKIEGDQDRLANIDYRVIPSVGRGYWFSDTDDLKAMVELGAGYQYTNYRIEVKSKGEPVVVPRFFVDKRLINKLHLSEDFTLYPSLADIHDYRFRSETTLTNPINDRWAIKTQLINEYNAAPQTAVKKLDYSWITALDYKF